MILAIDPGDTESAYVVLTDGYAIMEFGKVPNDRLKKIMGEWLDHHWTFAIEMIASYGMAVGKEVFETVFWIGRFWEVALVLVKPENMYRIYRRDVKMNLCHNAAAKDGNISKALEDRFGKRTTQKIPGFFPAHGKGWKNDSWSAFAVAVTCLDTPQVPFSDHEPDERIDTEEEAE